MTDGKVALLAFGGLFAFMGAWAGLFLWLGRNKTDSAKYVEEYVREHGIGETENEVRQLRKTL